jgi:hypothetical protein
MTYCSEVFQHIELKTTEYIPNKGQTKSGYGTAIPTQYMVRFECEKSRQWRRVHCTIFSNSGTLWVHHKNSKLYFMDGDFTGIGYVPTGEIMNVIL